MGLMNQAIPLDQLGNGVEKVRPPVLPNSRPPHSSLSLVVRAQLFRTQQQFSYQGVESSPIGGVPSLFKTVA
jgi:hypothetical protein